MKKKRMLKLLKELQGMSGAIDELKYRTLLDALIKLVSIQKQEEF